MLEVWFPSLVIRLVPVFLFSALCLSVFKFLFCVCQSLVFLAAYPSILFSLPLYDFSTSFYFISLALFFLLCLFCLSYETMIKLLLCFSTPCFVLLFVCWLFFFFFFFNNIMLLPVCLSMPLSMPLSTSLYIYIYILNCI